MKQKILIGVFVIILCGIILISNQSLGIISKRGYTIQNYDINMIVGKDNTFEITENITVNFNSERHGIYRKIPLRNSITRADGTKSNNRAKITDINISEEYKTYNEDGYKIIKIGNEDSTITGIHNYTIKYKYNIGKDPLKDADELYFNLIGNEWDANIEKVSFTIKMPKFFDQSSLGFSSGKVGSTDSSNVTYSVNENESIITGSTINALNPGDALTVRLTLPEGYFSRAKSNIDVYSIVAVVFILVCFFIAYKIWIKYGKNNKIVETVEFYPPEGYNPLELSLLYKGFVKNRSIISLLIYLANKGYLKIEEIEEREGLLIKRDVKLIKQKEYDGLNKYEYMFFKGIFRDKNIVYMSDLRYKFYPRLNRIKRELNTEENRNKIFDQDSSKKINWLTIIMIVIFAIITIKPILECSNLPISIGQIYMICVFILILTCLTKEKGYKIINIIFFLIIELAIVYNVFPKDYSYLMVGTIGVICSIFIFIFIILMNGRTPYGCEMLGKIEGFRRFLKIAEKPQLESLVEENPEYFFDTLSYAYALEVSDVWIEKFETILVKPPDWYKSTNDDFDIHNFRSSINRTMSSSTLSMSSSPPSGGGGSSGGGSSGGGSSGGGSGGGGGGSW